MSSSPRSRCKAGLLGWCLTMRNCRCDPALARQHPALLLHESKHGLVTLQVGAEMCGTLKNVVAVAAGIVDGLGYGGWASTHLIPATIVYP
jgi:glycerol-3-phosphate dehydrogenase